MSLTGYTDQHEGLPVWISDLSEAWIPGIISKVDRNADTIKLSVPSRGTIDITIRASTAAYNKAGGLFEASREGLSAKPIVRHLGSRAANNAAKQIETRQILPRSIAHTKKNMYDDMDELPDLNEAAILENIRHRFHMDLIYTRTGPILIAMNPFKWLHIYGEDVVQQYHNCAFVDSLPPHCFAIGEQAYRAMKSGQNSQSLIICGESGAGKTETTKLILRYLSSIAGAGNVEVSTKIMQSNPLMEAFGNAKTLRNNNSSRFGKFISVAFDSVSGYVIGATITNYLLEKSRCVSLPSRERNFHIFYQLCAGATNEQRQEFGVKNALDFYYLNHSSCLEVEGIDDGKEFADTMLALKTLNFSEQDRNSLLCIVAGILHLGNIEFDTDSKDQAFVHGNSAISLQMAARLIGIPGGADALGDALTSKVIHPPRADPIKVQLNDEEAMSSRDAFAKGMYHRVFDWLIVHIDMSLNNESETAAREHMGGHQPLFIGILDIYGFESLTTNGFEQLFINYANEKLQNLFNALIFYMEQQVYADEGIAWNPTDFPDNQVCLDLIEKRPKGILSLIDEECLLGQGTDGALVRKLHKVHGKDKHPNYSECGPSTKWKDPFTGAMTNTDQFVVRHYAGNIIYTCEQFLDKNRDTLHLHMTELAGKASNSLVGHIFTDRKAERSGHDSGGKGSGKSGGRGRRGGGKRSTTLQSTVAGRFKTQLGALMNTLHSTESRFVRCVKSNTLLKPQIFNANEVLRQLKYAGVMAALEMRRSGFPTRIDFIKFALRYHIMLGPDGLRTVRNLGGDAKGACQEVLSSRHVQPFIRSDMYRIGKTRIFLRADVLHLLDGIQGHVMGDAIISVQSWFRMSAERKRFQKTKACLMLVQAVSRGYLARARRRLEIAKIHRHALLRRVEAALSRMANWLQLSSAQARNLMGKDVQSVSQKLGAMRELFDNAKSAHKRASSSAPRRDSELRMNKKGKAQLHLEEAESNLNRALLLQKDIDRLLEAGLVKRDRVLAAKDAANSKLEELKRKYNSLKTSASSLSNEKAIGEVDVDGIPLRLSEEFERVAKSLSRAEAILASDDDSKYSRVLSTADQDLATLSQIQASEIERIHALSEERKNAYAQMSTVDEDYRKCISVVDAASLWEVSSVQRLVDDYEQKKRLCETTLSTSTSTSEFNRAIEAMTGVEKQLSITVEKEKVRTELEKASREKTHQHLEECRSKMRALESTVETERLEGSQSVQSAMRSARAAMDSARGYSTTGTDVSAYEAAVGSLKSELHRASEVVFRERDIFRELTKAKERGNSQLAPILHKYKALVASTEVSGIRNQPDISYVLSEAEDSLRAAKHALEDGHPTTMSSAVSEAGSKVEKALVEVERAKRQKNDEDQARQEARAALDPASKKTMGMQTMVEVAGLANVAAVINALAIAQQSMNRAQTLLNSDAGKMNVTGLKDAVATCLANVSEAETALNVEKKRRELVGRERRRLWKILDPIDDRLDRLQHDANTAGVSASSFVAETLADAEKSVEACKRLLRERGSGVAAANKVDVHDSVSYSTTSDMNIVEIGGAAVEEATKKVNRAAAAIEEARVKKTEVRVEEF